MKFLNFFRNSLYSLLNKRTLGVRMLLIDNNKVLLVKHTYQSVGTPLVAELTQVKLPKKP